MEERFKQTISDDLFNAWKNSLKFGDARAISVKTGKSYPVVQRALKYGHVNSDSLVSAISSFFADRKASEGNQVTKIGV